MYAILFFGLIGFAAVLLALYAIVMGTRLRDGNGGDTLPRMHTAFLVTLLVVAFLFSFPPYFPIGALIQPDEGAALHDFACLNVGQADAARLLNGQPILIRGRDAPNQPGPTYALCKGNLVAVGEIERGELHPIRVFNFSEGR